MFLNWLRWENSNSDRKTCFLGRTTAFSQISSDYVPKKRFFTLCSIHRYIWFDVCASCKLNCCIWTSFLKFSLSILCTDTRNLFHTFEAQNRLCSGIFMFRIPWNFRDTKNMLHLAEISDLQSIWIAVLFFNQREYQGFAKVVCELKVVELEDAVPKDGLCIWFACVLN